MATILDSIVQISKSLPKPRMLAFDLHGMGLSAKPSTINPGTWTVRLVKNRGQNVILRDGATQDDAFAAACALVKLSRVELLVTMKRSIPAQRHAAV